MSVWDYKTGRHYLIDTGADESVFPASPTDRQHSLTSTPCCSKDSRITTWDQRNIIVLLGSRSFKQSFHITDVRQPILAQTFSFPITSPSTSADIPSSIFSLILSFRRQPHWDHTNWASTKSGQMTMTWPPFSMNSLNYWFHASMPLTKTCKEWSTIWPSQVLQILSAHATAMMSN